MVGKTINRYTIKKELGAGSMGVVYQAFDSELERIVALKFLPTDLSADEHAQQRFRNEATLASAINHPNVCTIHSIEEFEDKMFIVMEYVEGQTLRKLLENGNLDINQSINIVRQAASGLQAAHMKGIIHRDIKPTNLMIKSLEFVKIMDFGLAKRRDGVNLTKEGHLVGTIAYMSPEQANRDPVDHRSDLWSLGVVFYEMLTGDRPFPDIYELAVYYAILNKDPEPLGEDFPDALTPIINKLLAKNPGVRYEDASALSYDLDLFQKSVSQAPHSEAISSSASQHGQERLFNPGPDNFDDAEAVIEELVRKKWPFHKNMRISLREKQREALRELKQGCPEGFPIDVFNRIRSACASENPDNYRWRLDCEKKRIRYHNESVK